MHVHQVPSSKDFIAELKKLADPTSAAAVSRFFHLDTDPATKILGVSIGKVFPVARRFATLPLGEVERLLESKYYEIRMGAVSIMDFQARTKKITPAERKALYDLYLRRHDRINNWDLVDRAAPHVVGGYLADRPRDVLYQLARSRSPWERRTAIVSTYYFLRAGEVADTFGIAELLVHDEHELVQKAVGSWIREAGKRDERRLLRFLDTHSNSMPRVMLRYAVEKLPAAAKKRYLGR
jgi:3-methyladenine DNA glycosylase AlkD